MIKSIITAVVCLTGLLLCAGCRQESDSPLRISQVYVTSDPSGAALIRNGSVVAQTPATLQMPPGEHLLILRKTGYDETRLTLVARPGERIPVEVKLEPRRGLLLVHSRPENAEVEIGDVNYGTTPLLLPNFPLGRHQVRLSLPGYLPRVVEVELVDRTPVRVSERLMSDAAQLNVVSDPAGAVVRVNGAEYGKTPYRQGRLDVGSHVLEVSLPGYVVHREEFTVKAGDNRRVNVTLTALPGQLEVRTLPPGARIYVDDQYRGESPYVSNEIPPGERVIRAELRGYEVAQVTNEVPLGGELVLVLELERNSGTFLVSTEPSGVTVFLNGENRGVTASRGEERISEQMVLDFVPEGRHTIQLVREGYYDVTHTRTIEVGQTEIIHEKMRLRPVQFVPNVIVRTGQGPEFTFRGIIRERFSNGDIKLELEPGIFKTFRRAEILEVTPIATH